MDRAGGASGFRRVDGGCKAVVVPENAYPVNRTYGRGWKCRRGFQPTQDGQCLAVDVPAHAYLDENGDDWECERGYARVESSCVRLAPPENAHLDYSGHGWECDRGYVQAGNRCVLPRTGDS